MARVDTTSNRLLWVVQQGKAGRIQFTFFEKATNQPWSFPGTPNVAVLGENIPFFTTVSGAQNHILTIEWAADAHDGLRSRQRSYEIAADDGDTPIFAGSYQMLLPGQPGLPTDDEFDVFVGAAEVAVSVGFAGPPGPPGPEGPQGPPGDSGLVAGGVLNDLLVKQSSTDFDVAWQDTIVVDALRLDPNAGESLTSTGEMIWDQAAESVEIMLRSNGGTPTVMRVGQDEFFYAKAASNVTRGQVVAFVGTDGSSGHILCAPFLANGTAPSKTVIGVASQSATQGQFLHVLWRGKLRNINTSGYQQGILYASPTVAGGLQSPAPISPNNKVTVAVAINSTNNGTLLVRPTFADRLADLETVVADSPQSNDLLAFDGVAWVNRANPLTTVSFNAAAQTANQIVDEVIFTSAKWTITAQTPSNKKRVVEILAINDGASCNFVEFANVSINTTDDLATFSVVYVQSGMRLIADVAGVESVYITGIRKMIA